MTLTDPAARGKHRASHERQTFRVSCAAIILSPKTVPNVSVCRPNSLFQGLWINSGVRQWRGHDVATGALFGVPSDILIWPHFHSQTTVPFVLVGVCQSVDDAAETTFKGGGG